MTLNEDMQGTFERIEGVFAMQQARSYEIGQRPLADRKADLKKLWKAILAKRTEIAKAMSLDLGKPAVETDFSEIYPIKSDLFHALRNLSTWAQKKPASTPLTLMGTRAWTKPEPKGVVLIISPWNFPFNLTFGPLVSALSAGNCVMLKPSESTPNCARVMSEIIAACFSPDHVALFEGDHRISEYMVNLPYQHIFFTGGISIGKKVMTAAAKNLTPVTLELGGKTPAIVDRSANLQEAARRIVWARFFNSGQVCISPDYILVEDAIADQFVAAAKDQITQFYGQNPAQSDQLSHLVHQAHYDKITHMISDALGKGATLAAGGKVIVDRLFVEPTILTGATLEMDVMKDEIFGPILPIIRWKTQDQAIQIIQKLDRPLALYIFSKQKSTVAHFISNSRAGTTGINETFIQFVHPELPFGGIGQSGMGKAHGQYGFDTFSNERSFIQQTWRLNAARLTHPPYNNFSRWLANTIIRWF
jgi:aldehyde dehydrogenase (NAD+)